MDRSTTLQASATSAPNSSTIKNNDQTPASRSGTSETGRITEEDTSPYVDNSKPKGGGGGGSSSNSRTGEEGKKKTQNEDEEASSKSNSSERMCEECS